MMRKKIAILLILTTVFCSVFAGCGQSDSPKGAENTKKPSAAAGGSEDIYKLPAGAASEYELYETVVDFLNNGFHYSDLKDVYDPNLTTVFYSKWEEEPEDIFTLGMKYDEACALISRLKEKASQMDMPRDEYGEIEEDLIDYDAFQSEFPESLQPQIEGNHGGFENFIEMIIYADDVTGYDGENPFNSDQTEWEKKGKDELTIEKYHSNDWDDDLYKNFPQVYEMDLGVYISYEAYSMSLYFTKIDGRCYLISFAYAISGIGG